MDRENMSNEENYAFDLAGFLVVPGVLGRQEVETLNRALDEAGRVCDPFRALMIHPQLVKEAPTGPVAKE